MYGYENHWFRSDRNEPMFPEISFQNFMLSKLCMAEFMSTTHCVSKLRRRLKSRHPKTLPNVTLEILNKLGIHTCCLQQTRIIPVRKWKLTQLQLVVLFLILVGLPTKVLPSGSWLVIVHEVSWLLWMVHLFACWNCLGWRHAPSGGWRQHLKKLILEVAQHPTEFHQKNNKTSGID